MCKKSPAIYFAGDFYTCKLKSQVLTKQQGGDK